MPVRSDLLAHDFVEGDEVVSFEVPANERWILKWWTWWGDTNIGTPSTREIIQIFPDAGSGVGVLYDTDVGVEAHGLVTNARGDHQAPALFVVLRTGDELRIERVGGDGFAHFSAYGARLSTS